MKKLLLIVVSIAISFTAMAQIKIGDKLPDFILLNTNNENINSSSFEKKFLLLDFWASWCMPCRAGNKNLVKMYNTLDKSKIKIVGISIDESMTDWKAAIKNDKIKFTQLIDPKGFDANTAVLFGVEAIPSKFLFDKNGILIAINPTEKQIKQYLK